VTIRTPTSSSSRVLLVDKETGEIEYVVAHTEWDRLDAMRPVTG
jgi:hypothetical protein